MKTRYYVVPKLRSVFKVQEGSYTQVVYEGSNIGVTRKLDYESHELNSWDLFCYSCNKNLDIIPTFEEYYEFRLREVNYRRSTA